MNDRRRQRGVLTNPVLIGAVTLLVAIVAVFLAYNANNGLPFVPRYSLHVNVRNASELSSGAEVHLGGALVGSVSSITPARGPNGQPIAVLDLALNQNIEPLPADSVFTIRLKGSIGVKYLDVTPGTSSRTLHDGATVPIGQTAAAVDLDQVLSMFDAPTRAGVVAATAGYGEGLTGRGAGINDAIGAFVPLVTDLSPVMRNLASRQTDLGGFFRGLESFTRAVAPVAQQQAALYTNLDTTFRSLATVAVPFLQNWISQTPPTLQTVISQSPTIRPFVTDTAGLFADLRPGFSTLPRSAPVLAQAFAAGTRNLPGTFRGRRSLDQELTNLARTLQTYGQTPSVLAGIDRLTLTASSLRSPLAFLTPVQASCNYVTLFLRNISSLLSDHTATGTTLRFQLIAIDDVLGAESVPSHTAYTTPDTNPNDQHGPLHANPYPNTNSPGQTPECSAGNEPYSAAQAVIGNPPGNVGLKTESTSRSRR
jgi:phospholipid/cholesterol/gamma-HCH transport system substrate-binding protein